MIVNDVEQGFVDLPDVVEECHTLDAALLALVEAGRVREDERVRRDSADMGTGVGIVGIDRLEERFERGGGDAFGRLACLELVSGEQSARGDRGCTDSDRGEKSFGECHRWDRESKIQSDA